MGKAKKLLIASTIIITMSAPVYGENLIKPLEEKSQDVYAKYEEDISGRIVSSVDNKTSKVTLDDGNIINVSGNLDEGDRIIIIPAGKDDKSKEWLDECIKQKASNGYFFVIKVEDKDGNEKSSANLNIDMLINQKYKDMVLYGINQDGSIEEMSYSLSNGEIHFKTDKYGFYALAEKNEIVVETTKETVKETESTTNKVVQETTKNPENTPQTGDNNSIPLMGLLGLVSAGWIINSRHHKRRED